MSTKSRLDKLYKTAPRLRLPEDAKILFISDLHMGDGGPEDDFSKNDTLCHTTLSKYWDAEYYTVLLGDIEDIWECPDREKISLAHPTVSFWIKPAVRTIRIKGNHDNSLDYPEAVVLQIGDLEIFCAHGHQGDFFNDTAWWIGQNVVRYLWVPLQWIGLHDVQKAKRKRHEAQEGRLLLWAGRQKFPSVFGHTHLLKCGRVSYHNAGSWVGDGGEAIVFENGRFEERSFT